MYCQLIASLNVSVLYSTIICLSHCTYICHNMDALLSSVCIVSSYGAE